MLFGKGAPNETELPSPGEARYLLLPNAVPGAIAEWLQGVEVIVRELARFKEPLGFEAERVAEIATAMIHWILRGGNHGAFGDKPPRNMRATFGNQARHLPRNWWVEAKGFLQACNHCHPMLVMMGEHGRGEPHV